MDAGLTEQGTDARGVRAPGTESPPDREDAVQGKDGEPATDLDAEPLAEPEPDAAPRMDETRGGRRVLTAFLLVTVFAVAVAVMPDSTIRNGLMTVVQPYLVATGLDQRWGVFAPNPRPSTIHLLARLDQADGTVTTHSLTAGAGISEYWNYRWHKYGEHLSGEGDRTAARQAFAIWLADRERAEGREPTRVTLVRQVAETLPPGPGPDQGPWREEAFFVLNLAPR